jgi:hypothetical protein
MMPGHGAFFIIVVLPFVIAVGVWKIEDSVKIVRENSHK